MSSFLSKTLKSSTAISPLEEDFLLRLLGDASLSPEDKWAKIYRTLLTPRHPFDVHRELYTTVYKDSAFKPAWIPTGESAQQSNISKTMATLGFKTYEELYWWSVGEETRSDYWKYATEAVRIKFDSPPTAMFDAARGAAHATYLPGARLNIVASCFNKRRGEDAAIVYASESDPDDLLTMSYDGLSRLANQVANAITSKLGLSRGDAVGICMPMVPEAIALYLGIVKAGLVVVSIADSFSSDEIHTRMKLSKAKVVFTQDVIYRGAKFLGLYDRVKGAAPDRIVVMSGLLHALSQVPQGQSAHSIHATVEAAMRPGVDVRWSELLEGASDEFEYVICSSMDAANILFSSGTTGEPKAIVWSHSTPVKCAADGYFHQDVRVGDVVAWPTNIGWMMGPWLIFQLINGATLALFNGITSTYSFCKFVERAKVSMLGVIPSLVKTWHTMNTVDADCDWSSIRRFSSTGEASDPVSMFWLMSRVPGYAPVIEYMGGTEIGGSFLSSTAVQRNVPSMFSTPVLGSSFLLLDENSTEIVSGQGVGEIALTPPAFGLSTQLLNRDHYACYFEGMPAGANGEVLRRHGDEIEAVLYSARDDGVRSIPYHRALGRCDDTMNLGGIKTSSVELERTCNLTEGVHETAAIAVSPLGGGPSMLVMFVVLSSNSSVTKHDNYQALKSKLQLSIKAKLNPLYHISDIVVVASLPRTASNKIMRRVLRDSYVSEYMSTLLTRC